MTGLVLAFGFTLLRVAGSHHIFGRTGITEQINLQSVNGKAKPYQIRQFLKIVERYNLQLEEQ
jgi:predicted RNA binding protein YcfA (HicA-like mRNA interferase family)